MIFEVWYGGVKLASFIGLADAQGFAQKKREVLACGDDVKVWEVTYRQV